MDDTHSAELKKLTDKLITALQGKVTWKWEDRFQMVLSEFDITVKDSILAILKDNFKNTWDTSTLNDAPDIVQQLTKRFRGLHKGQLLLTGDIQHNGFLYCAWWPWGNGSRISIRIAPCIPTQPANNEIINNFKEWFISDKISPTVQK